MVKDLYLNAAVMHTPPSVTTSLERKILRSMKRALIVDQEVEIGGHVLGTKAYPSGKEVIHEH